MQKKETKQRGQKEEKRQSKALGAEPYDHKRPAVNKNEEIVMK